MTFQIAEPKPFTFFLIEVDEKFNVKILVNTRLRINSSNRKCSPNNLRKTCVIITSMYRSVASTRESLSRPKWLQLPTISVNTVSKCKDRSVLSGSFRRNYTWQIKTYLCWRRFLLIFLQKKLKPKKWFYYTNTQFNDPRNICFQNNI